MKQCISTPLHRSTLASLAFAIAADRVAVPIAPLRSLHVEIERVTLKPKDEEEYPWSQTRCHS